MAPQTGSAGRAASSQRNATRSSRPRVRARARAARTASGRQSIPSPRQPNASASRARTVPLPHPRSRTKSPAETPARRAAASTRSGVVGFISAQSACSSQRRASSIIHALTPQSHQSSVIVYRYRREPSVLIFRYSPQRRWRRSDSVKTEKERRIGGFVSMFAPGDACGGLKAAGAFMVAAAVLRSSKTRTASTIAPAVRRLRPPPGLSGRRERTIGEAAFATDRANRGIVGELIGEF